MTLERGEMLIALCEWNPCDLINVLTLFQSFCNQDIFIKLNLAILVVLVKEQEIKKKYSSLSALK